MTNQNNEQLDFTGYCLALFYVRLQLLSVSPCRRHPDVSEARSWPGWFRWGRKLQLGSLKGCEGWMHCIVLRAVADFTLDLPVCSRPVWFWAWISRGYGLVILGGRTLYLVLRDTCIIYSYSYAVLE